MCFTTQVAMVLNLFIKELEKKFNKDDIGVIAKNKEKNISFNVKINVKMAGVTNKDGKEEHKNTALRSTDSCIKIYSIKTR